MGSGGYPGEGARLGRAGAKVRSNEKCLPLVRTRPAYGPSPSTGNVVLTNCSSAHSRQALSCKMAVEYDRFIESGKK
jgi:hypothetical protein